MCIADNLRCLDEEREEKDLGKESKLPLMGGSDILVGEHCGKGLGGFPFVVAF